ncbi:MAG: tetratricopeptide repeat protein, partial [Bacteroidota bacterium]
ELAEPLMKEAMRIAKESLGVNHPSYGIDLNNLAQLYQSMGRYEQAEPLMKEAIRVAKESLGVNHPSYGIDLNNLAMLYNSMGQYEQAEPLMKESMRISKESLGVNHPDYGIDLNNLGQLYKAMGQYEKAEPLLKEAIRIMKESLGENHLSYGTCLNNLALLYKDSGKFSDAISYYDSAFLNDTANIEILYWRAKCSYFTGDTLGTKEDCQIYFNKSKNSLRKIFCLFYSGNKAEALVKMKELVKNDTNSAFIYSLAAMYALNDRSVDALNYLEEALKMGYKNKQNILSDPNILNIRELPEFKKLIEQYFGPSK